MDVVINPFILYHEKCHAIAWAILFKNVQTKISITKDGGDCKATFKGKPILSKLGNLVGTKKSYAIISAAGPLGEIILCTALYQLFGRNSLVSIIRAIQSIGTMSYALLAYEKPLEFLIGNYQPNGHDYKDLRLEGGIIAVHLLIGLAVANCLHSAVFPLTNLIESLRQVQK